LLLSRQGPADYGEYREAAGAAAEVLNEPETKRKKAALAALVFEDWNGPTSSQRTVPVTRLKHIEAVETHLPKYRAGAGFASEIKQALNQGLIESAQHGRILAPLGF
jgi:hypothetical protein